MKQSREIVRKSQAQPVLFELEGLRLTEMGADVDRSLPFDKWQNSFDMMNTFSKSTNWWLGDLLLHGEEAYGEQYTQVLDATGRSYSSLTTCKSIAAAFPRGSRVMGVEWSKHEACAALMRVNPERAIEILEAARDLDVPLREVQRDVRVAFSEMDNGDHAHNGWDEDNPSIASMRDIKLAFAGAPEGSPEPRMEWLDDLLEIVIILASAETESQVTGAQIKAVKWAINNGYDFGTKSWEPEQEQEGGEE